MSWQIIPISSGLGKWRPEWDNLNARLCRSNPYFDSRFVEPLIAYFGTGSERLCVHASNGRTDGILILTPRRPGVWATFLPSQAQIAPLLVERPSTLAALFGDLPGFVSALEFFSQDPDCTPLPQTEGDTALDWTDHALTINVRLEGSFEQYWKSRAAKLQNNVKRYQRRVREAGMEMHLVHRGAADEMRSALVRYGDLESAGWKGRAGTAVHKDNEQGRFYQDVMDRFAASGAASIYELFFDDRLVASRLCVHCPDLVISLKTTYDESMSQFAPGRLLLHAVLQREFELARAKYIEFYTDANPDQVQWSTGQRRIRHATLFRSRLIRRAHASLNTIRLRLRRETDTPPSATIDLQSWTLETIDSQAEMKPEVRSLFDEAEARDPEFGLDWFGNLASTALPRSEVAEYHVLQRAGVERPAVILPTRHGRHGHTLYALTNFYSSLYAPLVSDTDAESALRILFGRLAQHRMGWSVMYLFPMDRNARIFEQTRRALQSAGWWAFVYFGFGNWYLPVEGRSFVEYFRGRPSQIRNTAKRRARKFLEEGRGQLEIVVGGERLDEAITSYERIYRASWKVPEPYPQFMPGLIRLCAERGWLRLGLAYYDDEPVAAQVWIVSGARAAIYKLAYDERFAHLSAGTVLTTYLMRHVMDVDKVKEVDYLVGDEPHKMDWMTHRRERWGIVAYNRRTLRGAAGALEQLVSQAGHRIWSPRAPHTQSNKGT